MREPTGKEEAAQPPRINAPGVTYKDVAAALCTNKRAFAKITQVVDQAAGCPLVTLTPSTPSTPGRSVPAVGTRGRCDIGMRWRPEQEEDFRVQKILHKPVITDKEYRQRIRRYKPSSLLPLIAATAVRFPTQQDWMQSPYRKYFPWALADVARVSLTHGTEFDRSDATAEDLLRILDLHSNLFDPLVRAGDEDPAVKLSSFPVPTTRDQQERLTCINEIAATAMR